MMSLMEVSSVGALTRVSFDVESIETISLAVVMTGVLTLEELVLVFRLRDGGLGKLTGNLCDVSHSAGSSATP